MGSAHGINTLLLVGAIATGFLWAGTVSSEGRKTDSDASTTVTDTTGAAVAVREYTRIVSTSTIARLR